VHSRIVKRTAALLPHRWQQELKRITYRGQIARETFRTGEPEWELASRWLGPGDWAIDVGANIGHYTKRFSDIVGALGRVFAFEPVPATFELLASNAARFENANVTLLNLAASESTQLLGMVVPLFDTGLRNYYCAQLTTGPEALKVATIALDSLALAGPVRLLKIDTEGHDDRVISGARLLIARCRPTIIVESVTAATVAFLEAVGYRSQVVPGSPNCVFAAV
jgi:FkbM family methyltransferase